MASAINWSARRLRRGGAGDALAEQVLLADDGEILTDEAALDGKRDQADRARPYLLSGFPVLGDFGPKTVFAKQGGDAGA